MRSARAGFTLVEVMAALVILGFVLLGMQAVLTDGLMRTMGVEDQRAVAAQLAEDRITHVQLEPGYLALEERYGGLEAPVSGYPHFSRSTTVARSANPARDGDYKTVTVKVWATIYPDTVERTSVIAAP